MRKLGAKQVIAPRKPVEIKAQRRAGEPQPVTQEIAGSNPVAPAKLKQDKAFSGIGRLPNY